MKLDLSKLKNVHPANGETIAQCPACAEEGHDEKGDHLKIYSSGAFGCVLYPGENGKVHRKRIIELVGIKDEKRAKWETPEEAGSYFASRLSKHITRTDFYQDQDGNDIFAVVRFDDKSGKEFRPFYRNGSGWLLGTPRNSKLPLFNLPQLIANKERTVFVTEGEKAAETATSIGLVATTSPYGAKSAHKADWSTLAGRNVVILPDNDDEGMGYANDVASLLAAVYPPATVKIVLLPGLPPKGDIVEWIAGRKSGVETLPYELKTLIKSTPVYQPHRSDNIEVAGNEAIADDPHARLLKSKFWDLEQQKLAPKEKIKKMSEILISLMHERGKFFFHREISDHKTAMFFDGQRKLLLKLSDPAFLSWLALFTGINRSEHEFIYLQKAIEDQALQGLTNGIVPETFWASHDNKIYISNGDGQIVRIEPGNIEIVDNGTDGILFAAGDTLPEWKLLEPIDPFTCSLFWNANFQDKHGLDLLRLWTMSLPANHDCKPPLLLTGQIRSGKTLLIRGLCRLYGLPERICEPSSTEEGQRNFWVSVNEGGLFCLDNADSHIKWLGDALEAASTGGSHERKKNYEDTKRISLYANAWVALTSANPQFANDSGLADRLFIIRMGTRQHTAEEHTLLDEVSAVRDGGLSFVCQTLSMALADKDGVENLIKRHPDFAGLAQRIGRSLGRGLESIVALSNAEQDKPRFYIENDTLSSAIVALIEKEGRFEGEAADLLKQLRDHDELTFTKWTPKGVGKKLSAAWPHLCAVLKCVCESRRGTKYYVIEAK